MVDFRDGLVSMANIYSTLAAGILFLHLIFIVWVIFGALITGTRPTLRRIHIACLVWGILVEVLPWPCPLTVLESWLQHQAGVEPYQGGFILHYLDALVYPNIPPLLLTIGAVAVCVLNLVVHARAWHAERHGSR